MNQFKYAFKVVVSLDDNVLVAPLESTEELNLSRKASEYDIYKAAKELSMELEQRLQASKIFEMLKQMNSLDVPSEFSQRVNQRLKERKEESQEG